MGKTRKGKGGFAANSHKIAHNDVLKGFELLTMLRVLHEEGRPISLYGSTYARNSTIAFICRAMGTTPNPNSIKNLVKFMRENSMEFRQQLDEIVPPNAYAISRRRDINIIPDGGDVEVDGEMVDQQPQPQPDLIDPIEMVGMPQPELVESIDTIPTSDALQLQLNLMSLNELRSHYQQQMKTLECFGDRISDNGKRLAGNVQQIVNTIYGQVRDAVERNREIVKIRRLLERPYNAPKMRAVRPAQATESFDSFRGGPPLPAVVAPTNEPAPTTLFHQIVVDEAGRPPAIAKQQSAASGRTGMVRRRRFQAPEKPKPFDVNALITKMVIIHNNFTLRSNRKIK